MSYDAKGTKLRQRSDIGSVIGYNDYIGPFVYKNGVLDYIITSEGRAFYSNGYFNDYEYHLKDHLGNTRVVFIDNDGTPDPIQRTDYYPFGMVMRQSGTSANKYLYNGKEQLKSTSQSYGVDMSWYDYGARMYDPQLGRWHVVDPLAENYYAWTPYKYGFNNPLRFIDPKGMDERDINMNDEDVVSLVVSAAFQAVKWFKSKIGSEDKTQGNHKYEKNGGINCTSDDASSESNENSTAKNPDAESVNIDLITKQKVPGQLSFRPLNMAKSVNSGIKAGKEIARMTTTDDENKNKGTGQNIDAQGKTKKDPNLEYPLVDPITLPNPDSSGVPYDTSDQYNLYYQFLNGVVDTFRTVP